jgi:hypothetical protein
MLWLSTTAHPRYPPPPPSVEPAPSYLNKIPLTDLVQTGTMLRVVAIVLALAVGFDHYMLNGKYTDVAVSMSRTILHYFRVL